MMQKSISPYVQLHVSSLSVQEMYANHTFSFHRVEEQMSRIFLPSFI